MSNAERYHFADFTFQNYRKLIILAKSNYKFRTYTNIERDERYILWRHDIDFSAQGAKKMAEIEADEGIISTYFLYLHSNFYNLLEHSATECVRSILHHGHRIGLHFDPNYYAITDEERLEALLTKEKKIIEDLFGEEIRVFSFHIITPFTKACRKWEYGGMINTYSDYLEKSAGYCSDSNGYWRFRRLESVLKEGKDMRLQVLTHPVWWQDKIMSPKERLLKCIDDHAKKSLEWYEDVVRFHRREFVDWD